MDLWQTITVIGRRWYVSLPVFLLGLAIAAGAMVSTKHQYESTGTVVLREPSSAQVTGPPAGNPANPMLDFADSLTTDASLLIQALNSPAATAEVAAAGGSATFTASDGKLNGPFIVVIADSLTSGAPQRTVELAFRYAAEQLQQREEAVGAPKASYIVLDPVVPPTSAALKAGGKSRFAGAVLILSVALTLTVTYAADAYLRRRTRATETAAASA